MDNRFRSSDIIVLNRSERSLEHFFEQQGDLLTYNNDSLCLYISGCPAMHLFELFIINITEEDYFDIKQKLWEALYVENWEEYSSSMLVVSGKSKIRVYKLYEHNGFDSLNIIRHNVNAPSRI